MCDSNSQESKVCGFCGEEKPASEFYRRGKNQRGTLSSYCRSCVRDVTLARHYFNRAPSREEVALAVEIREARQEVRERREMAEKQRREMKDFFSRIASLPDEIGL